MQQPFAYPAASGMTGFNAAMRGLGTATRTAQAIGIEWFDYAKQSYDDLTAALEKLSAARTPAAAFAVQGAYMRTAGERLSARSAVVGGLYMTLATDIARPAGPSRAD